ncbi:MAG: hypothetical protein GY863_06675, partial [bacterium]|nr:hypothetical protein [bacterium]
MKGIKLSKKKLVLFGIDGCPEEILRRWISEGKLPNFKRLLEQGNISTMNVTIPYITVPGWASMLTGKNPGRINRFSFFKRRKNSYATEPVNLDWDNLNPMWNVLSEHGLRSVFFNVPSTMAPRKGFNGVLVNGPIMNTDPENIAYPADLNERLKSEGYKIDFDFGIHADKDNKVLEKVDEITQIVRKKMDIARELFIKEKWDLFMSVVFFIDPIMHYFWKYADEEDPNYEYREGISEVMPDFFKMIDDEFGFYLDNLPEDTNMLIVGDHGFGPVKYRIDLNAWLLENGFMNVLTEKTRKVNLYSLQKTKMYFYIRKLYVNIFQKIGIFKNLRNKMFDSVPKVARSHQDVDWSRTKAYSLGKECIYINLKGREPEGIVEDGEDYEKVVNEIIEKLQELKNPDTGEPIVIDSFRGKDIYTGKELENMPDIALMFDGTGFAIDYEAAPGKEVFFIDHRNS